METPKWDFFERIEKIEPKVAKIEPKLAKLGPRVDDLSRMVAVTFKLVFMSLIAEDPGHARKIKDAVVIMLKEMGSRRGVLEEVEDYMLSMCDEVEKLGKSKAKEKKEGE